VYGITKRTHSVTILVTAGGLVLKQETVVKGQIYRESSIHNYKRIMGNITNNCCQNCVALFIGLPYVLIFPDMSSFSRLKLPSGRNL
jgi:hypothetical protein